MSFKEILYPNFIEHTEKTFLRVSFLFSSFWLSRWSNWMKIRLEAFCRYRTFSIFVLHTVISLQNTNFRCPLLRFFCQLILSGKKWKFLWFKYTVDNEFVMSKHSLESDLWFVKSIKLKLQKFLFSYSVLNHNPLKRCISK